jgi:hypothetical protein
MWRIYGGAVLVIAGITALIEAHSHRLEFLMLKGVDLNGEVIGRGPLVRANGLSETDYYLLRDGAWALVILGGVTLIVGLIRYWQGPRSAA